MATAVQRRRGSTAQHATFTGSLGELTIDTTKRTAVVHDGVTPAGNPLATEENLTSVSVQVSEVQAEVTAMYDTIAAGTLGYPNKAAMDADLAHDANTLATVTNDTTPYNNGTYIKVGASGAGSWLKSVFDRNNLFPDPEMVGVRAVQFDGAVAWESGERTLSLTVSGSYNEYEMEAVEQFAIGATLSFTVDRLADALTPSATVSIIFFNAAGAEISRVTNATVAEVNVRETATITGAVPALTTAVRVRLAKGSAGALSKYWPNTAVLKSTLAAKEAQPLRTPNGGETLRSFPYASLIANAPARLNRALVTGVARGDLLARKYNGAWRDADGRVLSAADGPCVLAGIHKVFSARDAVSVEGRVTELPDQNGAVTLSLRGTAPSVHDRRGILAFSSAGYFQADNTGTLAATLVGSVLLPAAQGPHTKGGFTCTGLSRDAGGLWIVGNDGRTAFGQPYLCSIVILSPDFRTVIDEFDMSGIASIESIQGVAWDSSDDTIWFVDVTNKYIRHIDRTGARVLADEIAVPTITPNGLAYDSVNDALWVTDAGVAGALLLACADGSSIGATTVPTTTDHIHYDATNGYLYCSRGNNGTDASIDVVDVGNEKIIATYSGLSLSQAIEGVYVEGGRLWTLNDGGFHDEANPALDIACEYTITPPPAKVSSEILTLGVVLRETASLSTGSQVICAEGNPLFSTDYGWALYLASTNTIRLIARMQGDAVNSIIDWTLTALAHATHFSHVVVQANRTTGDVQLWQDGVEIIGTVSSGDFGALAKPYDLARLFVGGISGATVRDLTVVHLAAVAFGGDMDREDLADYLAELAVGLP